MLAISYIILFLFLPLSLFSQVDTVFTIDSSLIINFDESIILNKISSNNQLLQEHELQIYNTKSKYEFLNYLPDISYSKVYYVSVGYSVSKLYSVFKDYQRNKATKQLIIDKYSTQSKIDYEKYTALLNDYKLQIIDYQTNTKQLNYYSKIYRLNIQKFKNNELLPGDYYKSEIEYLQKVSDYNKLKIRILDLIQKIKFLLNS